MINLDRVAKEIRYIGLYDLILQEIQKILKKSDPSVEDIKKLIKKDSKILEEYKQINVEYNLSNIHIKDISLDGLSEECKKKAAEVNKNLSILREIEKYTLDFANSSVLVIIFSIEFFVLFSVQYFIVLLSLKEYQWYVYGAFVFSIFIAWLYAEKEKKKYKREKERFEKIYNKTLKTLEELEKNSCIDRSTLWIHHSDDHI